jgi:hypothetical protein
MLLELGNRPQPGGHVGQQGADLSTRVQNNLKQVELRNQPSRSCLRNLDLCVASQVPSLLLDKYDDFKSPAWLNGCFRIF